MAPPKSAAVAWGLLTLPELERHAAGLAALRKTPSAAFRSVLSAKRRAAAEAFAATGITMENRSALGICVLAWTSPGTGAACTVIWAEGDPGPLYTVKPDGGPEIRGAVRNPARFGWPEAPPGRRQALRALRAFAARYAVSLEAALAGDD